MFKTRANQIASEESGQEIAEAALVLPILFLILLAIFWFGRAFNIASTVERAARNGVRTATQPSCVTCGDTPSNPAQIVASVKSILQNDHLDPANLTIFSPPFACTATPAPACVTDPTGVQICTGTPLTCGAVLCQIPPVACGTDAASGTRVSFGYRFTSALPIANLNAITITASAQTQSEQ
jgi:Flp pilus assembly protein TadG